MKIKSKLLFLLFAPAALSICSCQKPEPNIQLPVLSLSEVLGPYNHSAMSAEPVYSSVGNWSGQVGSGKKRSRHSDTGGKFFYYPPTDDSDLPKIYIQCDSPLKRNLVVIVSDEEYYGIYSEAEDGSGSWGHHKNIGKDCSSQMPLNINMLMESMALQPIDISQVQSYKIRDKYNVVELIDSSNPMFYLHELYFDRLDNVLSQVMVYSRSGKLIAKGTLDKYQQLNEMNLPREISISYLPGETELKIDFKKYKTNDTDKDLLFQVSLEKAMQYEQIDADCEDQ